MKRKLLFAATLVVGALGWNTAKAQTDVTSEYLTNADFEAGYSVSSYPQEGRAIYQPTGWTVTYTNGDSNDMTILNSGDLASNNFTSVPSLATGGNNTFLARQRWSKNSVIGLSQTVTIPAGHYELSADVIKFKGNGTTTIFAGDKSVECTSSSWTNLTLYFDLEAETKITLGFKFTKNSTPDNEYINGIDNFKLISGTSAAYNNPIATSFVTNGTFDSNINGWSRTGNFQNNGTASNKQGAFTGNFWENWNQTAIENKMYQTISNIPNGTYRLNICAFVNKLEDPNNSQYVFANNDKVYLTTGDPTAYQVWTVVTNNQIEIGLEQTTATANWMGIDNVSLDYYGYGDVITQAQNASHKSDWENAKAAAEAALANVDYANVTGSEKTALQTEINKEEPTTADGYDAATAELIAATTTFTAAKDAYDKFEVEAAKAITMEGLNNDDIVRPTSTDNLQDALNALVVLQDQKATANYTVDATNIFGSWTTNNTGSASGQHWSGDASRSYYDKWSNGGFTMSVTNTTTLPAGKYVFKAAARASTGGNNHGFDMSVTIDGNRVYEDFIDKGDTGKGIDTSGAANYGDGDFANKVVTVDEEEVVYYGRGWEWRFIAFELTEEKDVLMEVRGQMYANNWVGISDITLLTTTDNIEICRQMYVSAKTAAEAAKDNAAYANVNGTEKTALENAINVAVPDPATAEWYIDQKAALETATAAFTTAAPSYDKYLAEKAYAEGLNAEVSAPAVPTTAAEAADAANTYIANAYNWVHDNYAVEIPMGVWSDNPGTSGQHWDGGTSTKYWDKWEGSLNYSVTSTVNLPAGNYAIVAAGRAGANCTTTMSVSEKAVTFSRNGDTGKGIDTNGAANYGEGTFANDGKGRGWEWRAINFTMTEAGDVIVTMNLNATNNWGSFCDMKLFTTTGNANYAQASDYESLNNAIATAEGKTLGFEDGQYAPYNNVAALEALAAAKAINQTVGNLKTTVTEATDALMGATWTANSGDVDAIYNGMFTTVQEGENYPDGWNRTNGWGEMENNIEGDYSTAYYNQPGSLTYGTNGVYTLPLAANQPYVLTFAYRSHENNSNVSVTASVLNAEDGLTAAVFPANPSTSDWAVVKAYFTTGATGNYTLALANSGNTWMTGVSLVKATSAETTLAFGVPANTTYYENVNLDRTFSADKWNTLCVPFSFETSAFAEVKELSAITVNGKNISMTLSDVEGDATVAGKPYLVKAKKNDDGLAAANVLVNAAAPVNTVITEDNATVNYVGTYTAMTLNAENNSDAFVVSNSKLYNVTSNVNVGAYRAYFTANINAGGEVKALFFDGDEATAIESIEGDAAQQSAVIYNLAGQRLNKAQRGVNIINGKKVIVK